MVNTMKKQVLLSPEILVPAIINFAMLVASSISAYASCTNAQAAIQAASPDVRILNTPNSVTVSVGTCTTPLSSESSQDRAIVSSVDVSVYIVNNGPKHATIQDFVATGMNNQWISEIIENGQPVTFPYQLKPGEPHTWKHSIKSHQKVNSVDDAIQVYNRLKDDFSYNSSANKNIEWVLIMDNGDRKSWFTPADIAILELDFSKNCGD